MYKNILSNHIKFNDDFTAAPLFDLGGGKNIQKDGHDDDLINPEAVAMSNAKSLCTGNGDDTIVGTADAIGLSDAIATTKTESISKHTFLGSAVSESDAVVEALSIGIDNTGKIAMGKGNDKIIGVANVSAEAFSEASSQAELAFDYVSGGEANSVSLATADIVADGVGISNQGKIHTGDGRDTIIGIANVSATATSSAFSVAESVFDNNSVAIANSESVSVVEAFAVGIDNAGKINTGNDHDVIIGIANTATMTEANAIALTNSVAISAVDGDVVDELKTAISQSTSEAIADSFTTTLGIINSGEIHTGNGNDFIFGLANSESLSNSEAISEALAEASNVADANADAKSLAIANGSAVGIANLGKIHTGNGHDTIVGIAVNNSVADADNVEAIAEAFADDSDARVNTDAIADTEEAIAIGIDNADGVIETKHGNDRIIGYGEVGIVGGKIHTGKGHDRVVGYGTTVGVEGGVISLGDGNDYFKAMIVDFDPATGKVWHQKDLSGSIKDVEVFGGHGNDTFRIGGFEGTVSIDGGKHHDVLKLSGSVDDYKFTVGSSDNQFTIENSDSELIVKDVEELYFGNSDRAYSFHDLIG